MTSKMFDPAATIQVASGAEMSSFHGADTSEFTATTASVQPMPSPRTWSTATGETSKAAARKARATSSKLCRAILGHIRDNGPASPEELRGALAPEGFSSLVNTHRARCSDLAHMGLLIDSGERGVSEAGSRVIKWAIARVAVDVSEGAAE